MTKIERVKKGLECCQSYPALCAECPYGDERVQSCAPDIFLKECSEVIEELEKQ